MGTLWWRLPGPDQFLSQVDRSLRGGANCVVLLPSGLSAGIFEALYQRLDGSGLPCLSWLQGTGHTSPLQTICDAYALQQFPNQLPSARTLAEAARFAGKLIFLTEVESNWRAWSKFLIEYGDASRHREPFDRSLFCCVVSGTAADAPPPADVALAVHRWEGEADWLDMALLAAQHGNHRKTVHPVLRRLLVAIAAELAGSDPELVAILSQRELRELLDPLRMLADYARQRGWGVGEACSWSTGTLCQMHGQSFCHPALLALRGDRDAIRRLVWRAQVGVLFPYIEEQRAELIATWGGALRLPHKTQYGEITCKEDLEINHVAQQAKWLPIDHAERDRIHGLAEVRRLLAHLQPVEMATLRLAIG